MFLIHGTILIPRYVKQSTFLNWKEFPALFLSSELSNINEDLSLLTLYPDILPNVFIRSNKAGK